MKTFNPKKEFKVGANNIGWINDHFLEYVNKVDTQVERRPMPTFQKLSRAMNDAQIESELKPGFCELGDILAFLDNTPEECKDGYWNLFYFQNFVVSVYWDSGRGRWRVGGWRRGEDWGDYSRVFSPGLDLGHSVPSDLPDTLIINGVNYKRQ